MQQPHRATARAIGRVSDVFRFPIKSMQGESLSEANVSASGVVGDRQWALRDLERDELTSAKHFPRIMQLSARYSTTELADIEFPDGRRLSTSDNEMDNALSAFLNHRVSISRLRPASDRKHFKLRRLRTPADLRRLLGVRRGGPLPDLSQLSLPMLATLSFYATPPGSYLDALPIHIVTSGGMNALARANGVPIGSQRFRPNFTIETDASEGDYPERSWAGARLLVGECELLVCSETFRCGMPAHRQSAELPKAPQIVKTIYGELGSKFGVYARVVRPGRARVGDRVILAPRPPSPIATLDELGRSIKRAVLDAFLSL